MAILTRKDLVVDYGSTHIKGALVESSPLGGRRILRLETLPIVSLHGEGGNKTGEYEYNVIRFVQSFFPEEVSFILNLSMDRVYVRDIKIPVTNPKQIEEVMPFEVEPLLPVTLDHAEVIGRTWEIGEESSSLISFTAQHSDLQQTVQPLLRANATVQMLSVDCVGLSGAGALLPDGLEQTRLTGQVDIGGNYTILNFIKEGKLVFTRRIPIGGEQISDLVATTLGIEAHAAEQKKLELELNLAEDPDKTERSEAFYRRNRIDKKTLAKLHKKTREVFKELVTEIERTVLSLPLSEEPAIFYLSGGGSLIGGATEYMSSLMDVPVERYPFTLSNEHKEIARFMTAIGTVEHFKEKPARRFDFLSTAFGMALRRSDFTLKALSTPILLSSIGIIVLLLSFLTGILLDRKQIREYRKQIELIANDIPGLDKNAESLIDEAAKICNDRLQYRKNQTGSVRALEILRDLTSRTPPAGQTAFVLKSFNFDGKAAQFEAEVDGFADVQKIQEAYSASPNYSRIEVLRRDSMPNKKVRLALRLLIKEKGGNEAGCK